MKALDFVVSEAKKYGLKLILSLANNYVNFGGKAQYVKWACNAGQNLNSEDYFFTNPIVKGYYKNHVKVTMHINVFLGFIICKETNLYIIDTKKTNQICVHQCVFLQTVLTRVNNITGVAYKDDPTICSWELMNEPHCQSVPSGRTIQVR